MAREGWLSKLVGDIPLMLVFTVIVGIFLAPSMYVGGCVRFLIAILVTLVAAAALKQLCCAVAPRSAWAWRPKLDDHPWAAGFPSSHAATMGLFTVVVGTGQCGYSHLRRIVFAVLLACATVAVVVQRYLSCAHSPLQLIAGLVVGLLVGVIYVLITPSDGCGGSCSRR